MKHDSVLRPAPEYRSMQLLKQGRTVCLHARVRLFVHLREQQLWFSSAGALHRAVSLWTEAAVVVQLIC